MISPRWSHISLGRSVNQRPGEMLPFSLPQLSRIGHLHVIVLLLFDLYSYLLSEGIAFMGFITLLCYLTIPPHFGFLTTCRSPVSFCSFSTAPQFFLNDFQSHQNLYVSAPTSHPIICSLTWTLKWVFCFCFFAVIPHLLWNRKKNSFLMEWKRTCKDKPPVFRRKRRRECWK